jgi:uncharacterized protein YegJ (DUF2314 family)
MFLTHDDVFQSGRFSDLDPNMFVGCHVNRSFADDDFKELMWVHVTGVKENYLTGELISNPESLQSLKNGDHVTVTMDQIIDVSFLNVEIPKSQKRKLADAYINLI